MHGRKKVALSQTEAKILQEKAETYNALVNVVMERKRRNDMSIESLNLTEKMLKNNPDFYILWNYRRCILLDMYGETLGFSMDENISKILESHLDSSVIATQELKLSEHGIRRNPKSYGAWYHRKWIFDRFEINHESELELCALLLKDDQRNFHCWNYRRHVAMSSLSSNDISYTKEFEFSTDKIVENFSNYSAFHHRSILIKIQQNNDMNSNSISSTNPIDFQSLVHQEFSIIENAVFTEPDDQSAWWYHQFLLTWVTSHIHPELFIIQSTTSIDEPVSLSNENQNDKSDDNSSSSLIQFYLTLLYNQVALIHSLLDLENNNKWALICLVNLYEYLLKISPHQLSNIPSSIIEWELHNNSNDHISSAGNTNADSETDTSPVTNIHEKLQQMRRQHLPTLITIDPTHSSRYRYLLSK